MGIGIQFSSGGSRCAGRRRLAALPARRAIDEDLLHAGKSSGSLLGRCKRGEPARCTGEECQQQQAGRELRRSEAFAGKKICSSGEALF